LIVSETTEPVANVALEEALLDAVVSGELPPLLRVWRNEPCVVLGANRKVESDVDLGRMRLDDLPLVRRHSGGGTVYHDLNNYNLSLILRIDETEGAQTIPSSIELFCGWIIAVLEGIGLKGEKTGISDVSVNSLKISGHAQARRRGVVLHHATVLNRVDLKTMERYLRVPPERAGIEHRDFVTSLKKLGKPLSFADFCSISIAETGRFFALEHGYDKILSESLPGVKQLLEERYAREDWTLRR